MAFDISNVTGNPIILLSGVFAMIGWFIAFIAACIFQGLGGFWWTIIFELLVLGGIFFVIAIDAFPQYRLVVLSFLSISIAMLTSFIGNFINSSSSAAQAIGAGGVFLIIVQFSWVIIFGSDENSAINRSVYGLQIASRPPQQNNFKAGSIPLGSSVYAPSHNQGSFVNAQEFSQPAQPIMMQASAPVMNSPHVPHMAQVQSTLPPSSVENVASNSQAAIDKVTALHAYQANPEDATELSFAKGEVLEVLDKKGNWWQARKQDGSEGIIPSNYFAA
ncbi:hypothetical protein K450DRAFT_261907 [Umbelopsis ramanniana AG]|uniref:SH3 domain-containing protein n=1 Tax=Umbelopsis ramanniana AG TaxID=1314678 RepID=A0AAD5H7U7_UMBRA|nr:uncharacterized protein K450DRAFT_261907 [Umbelopsis ramanniana AG]KAI8575415.1 hypothetical protein K450DRAFT_261907 [Umbelopsis ramanniana AG]